MKFKLTIAFITLSILGYSQTDSSQYTINREFAGPEDIKITKQGKVEIVSASRTAKNLEDLPVTIIVVTHKDIVQNGYITLTDVIKNLPGMRVSQPGNGDEGETFLFRGLLGNSYSKILVNGVVVKPSVMESFPIGAQLPIRQAERIEIIYGPASSIYGADATAGVINIITRKAKQGSFAQADVFYGPNEYYYMNYLVGGKAGRSKNIISYNFYGSKLEFGDMNIYHTKDKVYSPMNYYVQEFGNYPGFEWLNIDQETFDAMNLELQPGYEGEIHEPEMSKIPHSSHMTGIEIQYRDFRFSFNHMNRRDHSSLDRSTFLYSYNNPQNYIGESINRLSMGYSKTFGRVTYTMDASYLKYRMDNTSNRGIVYDISGLANKYLYSASDDIILDHMLSFSPIKNLELTAGLYYQYSGNLPATNESDKPFKTDSYSSFSNDELPPDPIFGKFGLNPFTFTNKAFFVQGFYKWKKLTLMAGARLDHSEIYGKSINPRIAGLYKINENFSIRTSVGVAFKAPAANTAYYSVASMSWIDSSKIYYHVVPNPALKPEISSANEIGGRIMISDKLFVDITLFSTSIKNLITGAWIPVDTVKYPNALIDGPEGKLDTIRTYVNSKSAFSILDGLQLTARANDIFPSLHLGAELSYTWSGGHEELPDGEIKINSIRGIPKDVVQFRISLNPIQKMYFNLQATYVSSWYRKYIKTEQSLNDPYFKIDGYFNLDLMLSYKIWNQISVFGKILNAFDAQYGGIDATGLDVDMRYNPQLRRNFRVGLTYNLN